MRSVFLAKQKKKNLVFNKNFGKKKKQHNIIFHLRADNNKFNNKKTSTLVFVTGAATHANKFSNWKLKKFPYTGLSRVNKLRAVYKFFDYRAWKMLKIQQTTKFKKLKSIVLAHKLRRVSVKKKLLSDSAVPFFSDLQAKLNNSFFLQWFTNPIRHTENKLLYLKRRRFSLGYGQKIFKRFRYKPIYNYKHFYSKNFAGYFSAASAKKIKRNRFVVHKKSNRSLLLDLTNKRRNVQSKQKNAGFFSASAGRFSAQKAFFLKTKNLFKQLLKNQKIRARRLAANGPTTAIIKPINKKRKVSRHRLEFFRFRKIFFSNDRVLPNHNFILTLTATNSNMYVNVADSIGQTIFYHTMRRVGFQTGGSSKRASKVAVERLGIFIGKRLKKKRFFNKKFLVVFRGITWRRRFILKYIRFGSRRKIKLIGIIERSGLPHNGCKLKKRKHKRRSFLKLNWIKKKLRVYNLKRVFKDFSKRPVSLKKKTAKFLEVLRIKRLARLVYTKISRYRKIRENFQARQTLAAIKVLRNKIAIKKIRLQLATKS